jgi:hypothetical protein
MRYRVVDLLSTIMIELSKVELSEGEEKCPSGVAEVDGKASFLQCIKTQEPS